ncbi:hypothetical protein [Streptomyces cellulosae]|uniref:hypothetical protein n=1 Tax=Streptomyces cellulosae TaxID=1968 RepID=UPI0004C5308C|nr:hypothetical protein [Streptomyces cellulosae]
MIPVNHVQGLPRQGAHRQLRAHRAAGGSQYDNTSEPRIVTSIALRQRRTSGTTTSALYFINIWNDFSPMPMSAGERAYSVTLRLPSWP